MSNAERLLEPTAPNQEPRLATKRWRKGAILALLIGLTLSVIVWWMARSRTGLLTLKDAGRDVPMFVTLTHQETREMFDSTFPSRVTRPLDFPVGDYDVQIMERCRLSTPSIVHVNSKVPMGALLHSPDEPLWSSQPDGVREILKALDGRLFVVEYNHNQVSLIDPYLGKTLWNQHHQLGRVRSLYGGKRVLHDVMKARELLADSFHPTNCLSIPDLDADQVHDILIAHRQEAELYALSGASGKILWRMAYGEALKPLTTKMAPATMSSTPDLNGDGRMDFLVTFVPALSNPNNPEAKTSVLAAIDGSSGRLLWKHLNNDLVIPDTPNSLVWRDKSEPAVGVHPPFLTQSQGQPAILGFGHQQMCLLDPVTGQEKQAPQMFAQPIVLPPQSVRVGKGKPDHVLLAFETSSPGFIQFELWQQEPFQRVWIEPNPSWHSEDRVFRSPIVADLNGDSVDEIVLPTQIQNPNASLRFRLKYVNTLCFQVWKTEESQSQLQLAPLWEKPLEIRARAGQTRHILVGPDLDADGWGDLVTATVHIDQIDDRKHCYLDVISSAKGSRLYWMRVPMRGEEHESAELQICELGSLASDSGLVFLNLACFHAVGGKPTVEKSTCAINLYRRRILTTGWDLETIASSHGGVICCEPQFTFPQVDVWHGFQAPRGDGWRRLGLSFAGSQDLNGDGVSDFLAWGTDRSLFGVDGANGRTLWVHEKVPQGLYAPFNEPPLTPYGGGMMELITVQNSTHFLKMIPKDDSNQSQSLLFFRGQDGSLVRRTPKLLWDKVIFSKAIPSASGEQVVIVATSKAQSEIEILSMDSQNGKTLWSLKTPYDSRQQPSLGLGSTQVAIEPASAEQPEPILLLTQFELDNALTLSAVSLNSGKLAWQQVLLSSSKLRSSSFSGPPQFTGPWLFGSVGQRQFAIGERFPIVESGGVPRIKTQIQVFDLVQGKRKWVWVDSPTQSKAVNFGGNMVNLSMDPGLYWFDLKNQEQRLGVIRKESIDSYELMIIENDGQGQGRIVSQTELLVSPPSIVNKLGDRTVSVDVDQDGQGDLIFLENGCVIAKSLAGKELWRFPVGLASIKLSEDSLRLLVWRPPVLGRNSNWPHPKRSMVHQLDAHTGKMDWQWVVPSDATPGKPWSTVEKMSSRTNQEQIVYQTPSPSWFEVVSPKQHSLPALPKNTERDPRTLRYFPWVGHPDEWLPPPFPAWLYQTSWRRLATVVGCGFLPMLAAIWVLIRKPSVARLLLIPIAAALFASILDFQELRQALSSNRKWSDVIINNDCVFELVLGFAIVFLAIPTIQTIKQVLQRQQSPVNVLVAFLVAYLSIAGVWISLDFQVWGDLTYVSTGWYGLACYAVWALGWLLLAFQGFSWLLKRIWGSLVRVRGTANVG